MIDDEITYTCKSNSQELYQDFMVEKQELFYKDYKPLY